MWAGAMTRRWRRSLTACWIEQQRGGVGHLCVCEECYAIVVAVTELGTTVPRFSSFVGGQRGAAARRSHCPPGETRLSARHFHTITASHSIDRPPHFTVHRLRSMRAAVAFICPPDETQATRARFHVHSDEMIPIG